MILRHRYTGHQGSVYALCDDLQGGFYSGGGDRIVAHWSLNDPADGELIARADDAVYSLCLIPETGKLLIGTGKGSLHVIDLQAGSEERLLQLHTAAIFSITLSPDGHHFCTTGGDGVLNIIRASDFTVVHRLRLTEKKLRTLAFHPSTPTALAGCGDGSIAVIGTTHWEIQQRFLAHQQDFSVNCICFSPDGKYFLSGSRDAHLHLYETGTLQLMQTVPAHNYAIYAIAFDPTGQFFATASRDKTVKLWDFSSMEVLARLEGNDGKGHINSVNNLLWMKNGALLTAGDDRAIQLFQPES